MAVAIHVADDNVAGGVISEVASQVRIEKLQFQIRSLRPFPDGLEIRQDGWRVAYDEFREGRPFRLRLSREGIEIQLIVDQWAS